MSRLEKGHPGNRVYLARVGCADWCILVCARNTREARRMALPELDVFTGIDDGPVTPVDLHVHLYRRPYGGFVETEHEGATGDIEDYALVNFTADDSDTWYIPDGDPKLREENETREPVGLAEIRKQVSAKYRYADSYFASDRRYRDGYTDCLSWVLGVIDEKLEEIK
ncbi:hypothetical protein [Bifidobacterium sp. ESL0790]|uniref:hypothetical protein n=1 Tax=Bifidobacterium sp. ESL0790 TaxID=2983233 RepID=UPI0023F73950|nr:hypothetical protein [Bifidobacterium sp. ESL0790]WEV72133.1 hypothetical protein OZY47_06750 [Bifidobacterium sp. ESL0790]